MTRYGPAAGIWLRIHPEDRIKTPHTSWTFDDTTTRMPEFTAPALGNYNNTFTIDLECSADLQQRLRQLGALVPIIVVTAHDAPGSREQVERAGCSAYLLKPVPGEPLN